MTAGLAGELASLAAGLCQDAGIGLEVAPGGWSWDPVRRVIRVSAEGLATRGPGFCAGIVAHEVGHYFISRYTSLPVDFPSLRAARSLLNAIEDPRVDRWITSRYPGALAWQEEALVDELDHPPGSPDFLVFAMECAAEGDRTWRPSAQALPAAVVEALELTRAARRRYAHLSPPTAPEEPVTEEVTDRFRDEVWPALADARWVPARAEQRVMLSAHDALALAQEHVLRVAEALYLRDRDRVARWLCSHPRHAGRGRRLLERGRAQEAVAEALAGPAADLPTDGRKPSGYAGLPASGRRTPPWADQLAEELLDDVVNARVPRPLVVYAGPRPGGRPWETLVPELPPLPRLWGPATDYDRAYADVADQIEELVRHLEEILLPRRRLSERAGYPTGRHVDLRKLMACEADPRRYDELWFRSTIPDRRSTAIGLLVDLSGSMQGQKTHSAILGTVLLAETLERLEVPFGIHGFQDVLIPIHAFGEPFGAASRARISAMSQEVGGSREGGNNMPGYNDDGPCLGEFAELVLDQPAADRLLLVVSDGMPEGRRSTASDLRQTIARLQDESSGLELIGLGLGPGTDHVRQFYEESMAGIPLEAFARTIGGLIERALVGADVPERA